jgi:hypothetical protein
VKAAAAAFVIFFGLRSGACKRVNIFFSQKRQTFHTHARSGQCITFRTIAKPHTSHPHWV